MVSPKQVLSQIGFQRELLALSTAVEAAGVADPLALAAVSSELRRLAESVREAARLIADS